jgi:hypothetical protein
VRYRIAPQWREGTGIPARCGQTVQNLCFTWAQYMGLELIWRAAALRQKNLLHAAAENAASN